MMFRKENWNHLYKASKCCHEVVIDHHTAVMSSYISVMSSYVSVQLKYIMTFIYSPLHVKYCPVLKWYHSLYQFYAYSTTVLSLYMQQKVIFFNPLTPGAFCKICDFWTFWWFLGWILAKLALIQSKMRLQLNSWPFLPLTSRFTTL